MSREKAKVKTNSVRDTISARHHEIKPGQLAESESGASSRISSTKKSFPSIETFKDTPDIVCFSHLRWNFVFQRPQHILSRCAQGKRVFFVEEPIFIPEPLGRLVISQDDSGVIVVVPHLPQGLSEEGINADLKLLIDGLFAEHHINKYICWYYTPMAIAFTRHLQPQAVVYDCIDELSAFKGAPPALKKYEAELFRLADLVFTGGQSLYESKVNQHPNVYAFPSSVDVAHYNRKR